MATNADTDSDASCSGDEKDTTLGPDGVITVTRAQPPADGQPGQVTFLWTLKKWYQMFAEREVDKSTGDVEDQLYCTSGWITNAQAGLHGPGKWRFNFSGWLYDEVRHHDDGPDEGYLDLSFAYTGDGGASLGRWRVVVGFPSRRRPEYKSCKPFEADMKQLESNKSEQDWRGIGRSIRNFPYAFRYYSTMTVQLTLTLTNIQSVSRFAPVFQSARELLGCQLYRDFVLRAKDGKDIHLHRLVLVKHSKVFRAMLTHDTLEKKKGVCHIKDVDYKTLKTFVDVLYGVATVEDLVDIFEELYVVADKYQVADMERRCLEMLEDSVTVDNAVERFVFAKKSDLEELAGKVAKYVQTNYDDFIRGGGAEEIAKAAKKYPAEYFASLEMVKLQERNDKEDRAAQ